jgi:class 3 adenylate cyclase/tetratricopeptide (TPR) repeat protein
MWRGKLGRKNRTASAVGGLKRGVWAESAIDIRETNPYFELFESLLFGRTGPLVSSRQEQIAELRAAIAAQESMRSTLGDATVELSLKPLRSLLESLLAQESLPPHRESTLRDQALLAELQRYMPKQLADKIRASGQIEGERRQVTVVFADLSGFTPLAERLDPEEVASVVNDCMKELIEAVYQYQGMVHHIIGDCVMAVFGAPIALEDDAERALRAALAMRERLEGFNKRWIEKLKEPLALHMGINSGTVIAGNVGTEARLSYTVMGDTVNVASRLEGVATRGQILVTQSTYRLTRGVFEFRPLEPVRVQGKKDALAVFELLEAKTQRDTMRGLEGLISPFVGREWECKVLRKAIAATRLGRSALILVCGDAGVGKSRLLEEVRSCESDGITWLEGRCFAYTQTLSYAPILDLLRRHIGIVDKQNVEEQQVTLHRYVETNFSADPQVYAVLAQLLALPLTKADEELLKALKGEEFRARFFAIVEQGLLSLAKQQPVVVMIDDLQWADASCVDLLASILPLLKRTKLTFIVVSRSRQTPTRVWSKLDPALEECREHLVEIRLQSLSHDESQTLMGALLGGDYLPESLAAEILDKSEGNPFFLEEVLRSLIESGGLAFDNGKWTLTTPVGDMRVPDTLQGVLLSRLDRLSEELKQLTQKAAVIGRVFQYRILERIASADNSLREQLATLELSGLVRERGRIPELEFIFKHALTQEVAYQTLLTPARKVLHRKVGEALESIFRDRIEEFAGVLAYHFFSADSWQKALDYSIRSGEAAFRVCAYPEARGHYGRSLECLKPLEADREHLRQKVEVTVQLVGASLHAGIPEKSLALLGEAERIAESLNEPVLVARVQLWIGRVHYVSGKLKEAADYYRKVLFLAQALDDHELAALPGAVIGRVLFIQGRFREAQEMLNQAIPLLEVEKSRHELYFACIHRGLAQTCLGHYAAGLSDLNGTLQLVRSSRDQNAEVMAHAGLALAQIIAGEYAEGIENAQKALTIVDKSGDTMFRYPLNGFIAWGTLRLGKANESLACWAAVHEAAKTLGGRLLLGEWLTALEAESLIEAGDPATGLTRAQEALELSRNTESIIGEALAERAIGRAIAAGNERRQEALPHIKKSLEICQTIGARFEVVRALLAQGEALLACGDLAQAATVLKEAQTMAVECELEREASIAQTLMAKARCVDDPS